MKKKDSSRRKIQPDLLRFVAIGSVDDGKSTLIGRLLADSKVICEDHLASVRSDSRRLNRDGVDLALLTDGLRAEREQGITIDVAYRHFATPWRRFIIADTPGHVQYTRNMATGASTADAAIILIDAARGIQPQSRLHGFIASLLGIRHVIVAVNKMDLINYDAQVYERLVAEYADFSARLGQLDLSFIPVSATVGDNVVRASRRMPWYKGMTILGRLENVQITGERNLIDFRFPVQYVNRPTPDFRGYCGSVASGVVRVGDEVIALPSGRKSRVKRIVTMDGDIEYAMPPLAVTICMEDELDISRGDVLAHPANLPFVEYESEAMLIWMAEQPLEINRVYGVKMGSRFTRASCTRLHFRINPDGLHREAASSLEMNEIGRVDFSFMDPAIFDNYERNRATGGFVVVDLESNVTVAAGIIIERTRHRGMKRAGSKKRGGERDISPEHSLVARDERIRLLGQKPMTIWFTGLSGSGKSTLARILERRLTDMRRAAFVLDGDNIRDGLNSDLGFSAADRFENIRRVAEVARLMNEAGLIVITAFISPYRAGRELAREIIGPENFMEIFVATPLETCERRDAKGLYTRARAGELTEFTGVNAPYEPPETPALVLSSDAVEPNTLVDAIIARLEYKH